MLAFSNLLTCDADASTPIYAKINDTNTTNVFTFVKSGIRACALKSTCTGLPFAMYIIPNINNIIAGTTTPKINPALAILAVFLVPPNCEKVNPQNMIKTPINFINGLLFNAGQFST